MKVGILQVFQNYLGRGTDADTVAGEMHIAELAEPLGYSRVWPVEHHFTDYAACPDNLQYLSWLAGRTRTLELGTGAVIVPWNDPLRVAEKVIFLDHLSGGRAVLGIGRGLARCEYDGFNMDMGESRERFDEASRMIVGALETGFIEGDGPFYPQRRTELRPRPRGSFKDRFYCVGMSPDSVEQAAKLGGRLTTFSQKPWEMYRDETWKHYQECYRAHHQDEPPYPLTGDLMFCHPDADTAQKMAEEYMANYFLTIVNHYELMSEHFSEVKGYDHYRTAGELFRQVGLEPAVKTYVGVQTWGTPEMILEKLRWRKEMLGGFELNLICNYGGLPLAQVEASIRLFAQEVIPEIRDW